MSNRIRINQLFPEAYKALIDLDKVITSGTLSKIHIELIRIRASQLNGCSFCVDKHSRDARANGETEQRIYALSVWRDTPFFTEEERAILALTEEATFIHAKVSDATYEYAEKVLGEKYLAEVMMMIIVINAWNRVGVATAMMPALQS
jgi:AhpD family alkylhydroperoxidase